MVVGTTRYVCTSYVRQSHTAEGGSHIAEDGMYALTYVRFYRLLMLGVGNVPRTAHALVFVRMYVHCHKNYLLYADIPPFRRLGGMVGYSRKVWCLSVN